MQQDGLRVFAKGDHLLAYCQQRAVKKNHDRPMTSCNYTQENLAKF
jgi:hypothetical protein